MREDLDDWRRRELETTSPFVLPWPRSLTPKGHPFGLDVARFMQEIRDQSGLTQQQLAAMIETTQPAISKIERGRHLPSLGMLIRIGEATNTPLEIKATLREPAFYGDSLRLWPLPPPGRG